MCRSGKVIKKNQKLTFKSLDVTISMNENGREISTSKRLEDATVDMCVAMGVSKAIINHVLFYHQEESSWPLGTDVEVMKIFDEIFGTTEYNNALEKMRAMRKKYESSVKEKSMYRLTLLTLCFICLLICVVCSVQRLICRNWR